MLKFCLIRSPLLILFFSIAISPTTIASVPTLEQQLESASVSNDVEAQERLLNQILKQNPDVLNTYRLLGYLLETQSRYSELIELYQTALKRFPKESVFYEQIAFALAANNRKAEAIALYQEAIRHYPTETTWYIQFALMLNLYYAS
jgi:tetratricopeptide (TPR) repeat protein